MITETGTIKVKTPIKEQMQKEFLRNLFITSLVCLIIGSVGIALYIVLDVISVFGWAEPSFALLIACAFAFGFGLIFIITTKIAVKKARSENKVEVCEFFSDHVIVYDYVDGENIAQVKVYYNRIVKRKETKSYLFFYVNAAAMCPVEKAAMTQEELNFVRSLLGFKKVGGGANFVADGENKEKN